MVAARNDRQRFSRRDLLRTLGVAPFLYRSAPLFGMSSVAPAGQVDLLFAEARYTPHYPARSPLDSVLRLVSAGSDEYSTELYAAQLSLILQQWSSSFREGDLSGLAGSLDPSLQACSFAVRKETPLRVGGPVESSRREFATELSPASGRLLADLRRWIGADARVEYAEFEITSLRQISDAPLTLSSAVRYNIVAQSKPGQREQRVGTWAIEWRRPGQAADAAIWKASRWHAGTEARTLAHGPGFVDVTKAALGRAPSYRAQLVRGADYWRTVLDGACGIDVYGNNGVAAGDFDGDGMDDLYICQPAGLPNRLYRNRGDGTFDDVTEQAGVGVLDNTACALFADLRNTGLQDLLVVCGSGPLLFLNQGNGTFVHQQDAFRFAQPAQGTFTHAAIADYDRDGRLDIYFCLYSYYLGLDQYHYPAPYFDARNGPPNFLFHNNGDGTFTDTTQAAGLSAENDRYSFSCAWGDAGKTGAPDLYVVNDFGRNNLYRNNGDGTFRATSTEAHVEDVGAGMSACWTDYNNDGAPDLYVANMWSAAGQRVSEQAQFHEKAPARIRELYQRHARGNALYRNLGDGHFQSAGEQAGLEVGRWAWSSDAWDFDHDGFPDIYVTNGYITAPERAGAQAASPGPPDRADVDLGSFFWRQVVGKSPEDATPSQAYERGWNALNELIRSDGSWSGSERNAMFANNRDGTFSEISGAVSLDFLEDGRSFALADLDGDGRLEVIVKNRNGPQLRVLRNAMEGVGHCLVVRLRGTKSNRDAIGASVTVVAGELRQTRSLEAGSGFLSQHSKELFFGLASATEAAQVTVHWPSGLTQHFDHLPANQRVFFTEGQPTFTAKQFTPTSTAYTHVSAAPLPSNPEPPPARVQTWLIDTLKAPSFTLPDLNGAPRSLGTTSSPFTLLHLWVSTAPQWRDQLREFRQLVTPSAAPGLAVLALNLDLEPARAESVRLLKQEQLPYPVLLANEEVAGIYNLLFRYLFDRRRNLELPTSFLLDHNGRIAKVYQGTVRAAEVLDDLQSCPATEAARRAKGLPFPGTTYQATFVRNTFTYGVAMFQHGYFEQAQASFQEAVAARPDNAEGYYNLGTLSLRQNNFTQARTYFQQTLQLKPDYPEAWNNLGMMAAQEGHPQDAIQAFQKSLALRPDYATALLNLGNIYRRNQAIPAAQEALARAETLQPDDPEISYSLGMLAAQQNNLQAASTYLQRAITLRPDYPEARNNLGVLLVRQQNYSGAQQQFEECIAAEPGFEESYLNLARLYVAQRETPKARATLTTLLLLHPDSVNAKKGLEALNGMQ